MILEKPKGFRAVGSGLAEDDKQTDAASILVYYDVIIADFRRRSARLECYESVLILV